MKVVFYESIIFFVNIFQDNKKIEYIRLRYKQFFYNYYNADRRVATNNKLVKFDGFIIAYEE